MLNATLIKREDITPELFILSVEPDGGVTDFIPGQYVALGLPGSAPRVAGSGEDEKELRPDRLVKRAYSIGSSPRQKDALEFYVALVNEGSLTPRLAALAPGDRLFAAPKVVGTFTCSDVSDDQSLVLVSTGTGLAPYISMVRTPELWTAGRSVTILHGVRYRADLGYRDELLQLQEERPEFSYFATVSREDPFEDVRRGYVQEFLKDGTVRTDPEKDHVFVCGNPAMIEDVEESMIKKGYVTNSKKNPEGSLHLEKYW
jgi:ferredoxin--NADP+ reductase